MTVFAQGKVCPDAKGSETSITPLKKDATKILRIMKLTVILLTVAFLQANANGFSQTITYSGKEVPLEKIFSVIKEQAGFGFIYFDEQLKGAKKVTINVKNAAVEQVLAICMKDQPYEYTIKAKTIFIINKQKNATTGINISNDRQKGKRINISGKVTGEQGEAVYGATITVKGSDLSTATNDKGEFFLSEVEEDAILVITNVSYQMREISLKGRSNLNVQLKVKVSGLDETVVVAYNTTTARKNTSALTVVKGETIESLPNRSIDRSLQGMVPGLLVTNGNGQPGGGTGNFFIRGIATAVSANFGSTVRNPLIVIDGVPINQDYLTPTIAGQNTTPSTNPMAQFNTSDIESLTVLKDAAAIALYGTRAANGVIVITTKKGKAGKARFEFRHQTDISARVKNDLDEVLNQDEYLELLYESYRNKFPGMTDAAIKSDLIKKFPTIVSKPGDTSFYEMPNWFDDLYNKRGITVSNNMSLSGGTEKGNYYLNFEYTSQDGIVKNTGYKRSSIRYNMENNPTSWVKLGVNSFFSYNKQDIANGVSEDATGNTGLGYVLSPLLPNKFDNGDYSFSFNPGTTFPTGRTPNPAAALEYNLNQGESFRQNTSAFAEIKFLQNLKFKSLIGVDFMLANFKQKTDPRLPVNNQLGIGAISENDNKRTTLVSTNILSYNKNFGKHNLNILVGQESQEYKTKRLYGSGQGLAFSFYDQLDNSTSSKTTSGSLYRETLLSYFSQLNYSYSERYFLSASARRDGSSKFGINERFGNYWSLGAGWVISNEEFIKRINWLDFLKIRGSLGTSGNSAAVTSTTRFQLLTPSNYAGTSGLQTGPTPANENIRWEQTFNTDLGLELQAFKKRIDITLDVYKRKTSNLIYPIIPLPVSGYETRYFANFGEIQNKGIELSLSADIIRYNDFRWNVNFNWSTNKNKLLKVYIPPAFTGRSTLQEGDDIAEIETVRWAGVNPSDGKPQWLDTSGNLMNTYNRLQGLVTIGKFTPTGFGGINTTITLKNLELGAFFYYQYGYLVNDNASQMLINDGATNPYMNQSKRALDRWQKPGDVVTNPRRILNNTDGGNQPSNRYFFNGDYIRLKTISLAYGVPHNITNLIKAKSLRITIQVYNLALWSKYKGIDPENIAATGAGQFAYPQAGAFSFGLNLGF